ncbi:MAG: co-chaperone GroES [Spirochaetales bacterium]|jgi:chaperonin GroES|nr:co-chaperone GroES [Spirochaetales bacterium]MBQ7508252.1 co-chaperone GroES [Spirochaetales bacterium]MBR6347495.1 co-chaperone GroES [Spirochaetales bacterium]
MTVKPLGERVLVKMDKVEEKTAGGIYIPQTAQQEKTQIAVIEAIGADVKTVKAGQKILHDKYAGTSVKIDGEDYLILNIKDVLAVIE